MLAVLQEVRTRIRYEPKYRIVDYYTLLCLTTTLLQVLYYLSTTTPFKEYARGVIFTGGSAVLSGRTSFFNLTKSLFEIGTQIQDYFLRMGGMQSYFSVQF